MQTENHGINSDKKKILIVSQYFWPENFRVNDIANFFIENNFEVEILTGYPNYPTGLLFKTFKDNPQNYRIYKGARINRVPILLRKNSSPFQLFFNYLSFNITSIIYGFFLLRKKNFDYVFCFATSPVTSALTSVFFKKIKNAKSILWVLDLWPEVINELNYIKKGFVYKILDKIIIYIYRNHDLILAQSQAYLKNIQNKLSKENVLTKVSYFYSWPEFKNNFKSKIDTIKKNKFNIIFTGNIGEAQNFDLIINIVKKIKNKNINWHFVGSGRYLNSVKNFLIDNDNVIFHGQKPIDQIITFFDLADALLLPLRPGSYLYNTIPGKFQTYLTSGKPIIGLMGGEVMKYINDYQVGFATDSQDVDFISNKITNLLEISEEQKKIIKKNSLKLLEEKFNKEIILGELLKEISLLKNILPKKIELRLINNINRLNGNYIVSGLNLAYLGYYIKKTVTIKEDFYFWPDGLFKARFFGRDIKKVPGRTFVNLLELNDKIKRIIVLGNSSAKQIFYLKNKFKKIEICHIPLPIDTVENLYKFTPDLLDTDLVMLTLPTPKQEELAYIISARQKYFKILCIGGALLMASGEEKPVFKILENVYGVETLWRLRTDSLRRSKRLIETFYYYLKGEIFGMFKNIQTIHLYDHKK
jgi:colanic acid biosynthesis glycosyl transferase WcaI